MGSPSKINSKVIPHGISAKSPWETGGFFTSGDAEGGACRSAEPIRLWVGLRRDNIYVIFQGGWIWPNFQQGECQMSREIQYLAIVQLFGLEEEGTVFDNVDTSPVNSKGFHSHLDAIRWVRDHVEAAHEEVALVIPHFTKLQYDFGGQPVRLERWMWTIICSGGPTWGMVIDVSETTSDVEPAK